MATKKRRRRAIKAANPRRRRRVAAASNPRRRRRVVNSRRARRNGTKVYVIRKNRRRNGSRRNPEVFGLTGVNAGKAILSGLVGVYAAKTITPMIASAVPTVGSSSVMGAVISAVVAWGGGSLVARWDKTAGAGFMFGGLMQAGSQLLNMFVSPNPLSLNGLGDFVPGGPVGLFPTTNPIRQAAMARAMVAAPAPVSGGNLSGMGAAASFV